MAATAKHELRQKFPTESNGEEDIAAIAKQISDHAEAIYQTWKSRGLAPTEILNCHSNATAADKFDSVLKPGCNKNSSPTAAELLAQAPNLDNNNLEKLVNNFVVEDKARLAAASRQKSPSKNLPSSIQYALQKFERNTPQSSPVKISPKTVQIQPRNVANSGTAQAGGATEITRPQVSPTTKSNPAHHNEIFLETIETTFPADLTPARIIVQQKRPASVVATAGSPTASSSGLTTWPLKNKISTVEPKKSTKNLKTKNCKKTVENGVDSTDYSTAADIAADEVAREEERLINALMTGVIIPEELTSEPQSQTPIAKQKPAIKKEKPKVEPVKPIILSHSPSLGSNGLHTIPGIDPMKTLSKEDLSAMSMVDYAKVRYRAAQQNPAAQKRIEAAPAAAITGTLINNNNYGINEGIHHHNNHHHHHHHHHRRSSKNGNSNNDEVAEDAAAEKIVSATRSKFEPSTSSTSQIKDKEIVVEAKDQDRDIAGTSRWGPRVNSPSRPRLEQLVPHPELTTQQRQHIRANAATAAAGSGNNPVRPFLTRGSVAERVLIFEKCPSELLLDKRGPRQPAISTWRTGHEVQSKAQIYAREKTQLNQKNLPPHTTLQRHVKANRNVLIPRFYFPGGKPIPTSQLDATLSRISAAFQSLPGHRATKTIFHTVTKACDCPLYWKVPLFLAAGGDKTGYVDQNMFIEFWKEWSSTHHDAASRFVRMTTRGIRDHIIPEDLIPLVQDVVETHPGLTFLKEATEFHSRYVHTVVARIFYSVNRSWSGKISVAELRRSNLLAVISVLEHEEDINQVTAYFSYEHFYVIYCKFWELDRDHDLFIDKLDLTRHNDNALSTRMIERIFSGAVTRGGVRTPGTQHQANHHDLHDHQQQLQHPGDNKMSYTEFVWFLLSEEDKNHPTAIEYWFRCMDLDGDGYLSMYELEYFYEEQLHRMEAIGIETLPFEDCLCQMLDMIHPTIPGKISLSDLKRCKMTSIFFDTFFNLEKYLDHEQRDPFASTRDHDADGHELSDWDRFAAEEYELLVAEESGNDQNEQMLYESSTEDGPSHNLGNLVNESEDMDLDSLVPDVTSDQDLAAEILAAVANQEFKTSRYDSGDSDDYADSDN